MTEPTTPADAEPGGAGTRRVAGSPARTAGRWAARAVDVLLLLTSLAAIVNPEDPEADLRPFMITSLLWIVVGSCYIGIRVVRVLRSSSGDQDWPKRLARGRTSYLISLSTAIILLGSGLEIVGVEGTGDVADTIRTVNVITVLLAWAILHLSYAERYAQLCLGADDPPLSFPHTPAPTLLEFVYFSFTVGTTFVTSDVEIRSARARGMVLAHGLITFVYNTAILGLVVGLITST
ncbi:DUF1345 domain-containing protein [Pseudonocardia xinjiangensis]|uniref:DUF1345 domain-containing protein n=1 Tax=Pseudonocardia xinjiangensis TaxID=75289 RepID=UPI003D8AB91C